MQLSPLSQTSWIQRLASHIQLACPTALISSQPMRTKVTTCQINEFATNHLSREVVKVQPALGLERLQPLEQPQSGRLKNIVRSFPSFQ